MIIKLIITALCAYVIGSFSASIILSTSVFGGDVRKNGSGNAGATNMARVFGKSAGALTLIGDVAKGIVAILIGKALAGENGIAAASVFCLLGHCFPVFYGFKGGKGVAVGLAIMAMSDWKFLASAVVVFVLAFLLKKRVSLGSVLGCVIVIIETFIFPHSMVIRVMLCICASLVIFQHRENIKRLLNGTEKEFSFKKKS